MSLEIYTYHDPYKINQEPFWKYIKDCPYFCVSQTLVNGLRTYYKGLFNGGRVTTVKVLTDSLYSVWESTATVIKQHTIIDNIINGGLLSSLPENEEKNIKKAFLFNREEVFKSIRTLFELNVDTNTIMMEKLTKEQHYIIDIYKNILGSDYRKDFSIKKNLSEEEINESLYDAMRKYDNNFDVSSVNMSTIVLHGIHQFSPIMLRAIDELQKYKKVILIFNYQKQYSNVYQTWYDIYSAFDCKITDCLRTEYYPSDSSSISYRGNVLADQMGKLINGQRKGIYIQDPYEILEFDNMTEFANYAANVFEQAAKVDPENPMKHMQEQIYAADSSANNILKIYFPKQFGERQFLNYPLGHFFIGVANMWDSENNTLLIKDMNDIRECLNARILSESYPGELGSIFGKLQAVFDGCTSIKQMRKRLKNVLRSKKTVSDDTEEYVNHISYYAATKEEIDKLSKALSELEDLSNHFYEDFDSESHNFKKFYKKLQNYLQTDILEERDLSEEFEDILKRVLERLNEVQDIGASASFECLKSTMSIYLQQTDKKHNSANWIVRNFEQIDGDILRSPKENPNIIYHFACLEDEDIGAVKKSNFPWPLTDEFFEIAQNPVDWKYQVYVKCCQEYKNFKRYALIYGLEFNRAKFKLSYVKHDGDKVREPYYLLQLLGIEKKKYKNAFLDNSLGDTSEIQLENGNTGLFNRYDDYRYRICKYRFLMETLIESNTVYKDNFLLLKYMEVMLENVIKEDMQGKPISEEILLKKLDDAYEEFKKYFPFSRNVNRMDVINNIRNRIISGKEKKFPVLSAENRRYMMIRELFIHKRLENTKNVGVDIMQDKFPIISNEQVNRELNEETLRNIDYITNVDAWCQYCSNRELCTAFYRKKE